MAVVWAVKTGNWSDPTVWNTGALPDVLDVVVANKFTVTINQDIEVDTIRNTNPGGLNNGGGFIVGGVLSCTIIANVLGGKGNYCLSVSSIPVVLYGNISCAPQDNQVNGVMVDNAIANFTVVGNVYGGDNSYGGCYGIRIYSAASVEITGNLYGGFGWAGYGTAQMSFAVFDAAINSIFTLHGTTFGSSYTFAAGFGMVASLNCLAYLDRAEGIFGEGASNYSSSNTCIVYVGIAKGSDTSQFKEGVINQGQGKIIIGVAIQGLQSNAARGLIRFNTQLAISYTVLDENDAGLVLSSADQVAGLLPAESDVRYLTVYDAGNKTGSLRVATPDQVLKDVPTDNTVGTAVITKEALFGANADEILTGLVESIQKIDEFHSIHGLKAGSPLEVTDNSRKCGDIEQTIEDDGETTTVTRL
jgi:hypothetical protein